MARDLKKIDKTQAEKILQKIELELPSKAKTIPVLTGQFAGLRKFRAGKYRVIFSIIGDTVLVLRNAVYSPGDRLKPVPFQRRGHAAQR